jgi:hypothetical protein
VTADDLVPYGITPEEVRRRCPTAVERVGLHGERCWLAEDLAELLDADGEEVLR